MRRTSGSRTTPGVALLCMLASLCTGCGVYSFSGSTLPSYLKTVSVPLFANQTLQNGVAEAITSELAGRVVSGNQLRTVSTGGDATLTGVVTGYSNEEYQYDIRGARTVDVKQYMVTIVVSVEFVDNRKSEPLYRGTVRGQGVYDFGTETEAQGRQRAIDEVVRQVLENSIQSW